MNQAAQHPLSVVIPAYNEEGAIAEVLRDLAASIPGAEIIVVNDGSTDETLGAALAAAATLTNVSVFSHRFNRGYGASLKTGMSRARGEYVAWFDADAEHRTSDLKSMFEKISSERLAAVIGIRKSRSTSLVRGGGKAIIRLLTIALGIPPVSDLNCGLRIFRRGTIANYLSLLPDRYSASMTTTILMLERGYPVNFHPIQTNARIGHSKVRTIDGFRALTKVFQLITLFAPMRLFFRPGLVALLIGLAYGVVVTITQRNGFPTASLLVCVCGMLLCILGLVADQISQMRLEARTSDDNVIDNQTR
jgi:glycosyltransferase involved in cell wall biosynthesis